MDKPFTIHTIITDLDLEPLKVILPNDGHRGFVIGEDWEVKALFEMLGTYIDTGVHDGEIPDYHEQLGTKWMTVGEAAELANAYDSVIPERTIRWAASHGYIKGAKKIGRDWHFSQRTFFHWMRNRPKPGPK